MRETKLIWNRLQIKGKDRKRERDRVRACGRRRDKDMKIGVSRLAIAGHVQSVVSVVSEKQNVCIRVETVCLSYLHLGANVFHLGKA